VQLKLVGRVDPPVLNSIEAFGLTGNLNLIAQVPYNEVIRIMKAAPVLLLPIDVFDGSKWVLTGKLYEYLASGRPVVCIGPLDGDAAAVVEESRAGKAFDFGDVAGLKAHLITLHQQFVAGTLRIEGSKVDQYSRKHLTGELADELNRITA
jgi:glycosyltransferase involved in cell wall biosynthesis